MTGPLARRCTPAIDDGTVNPDRIRKRRLPTEQRHEGFSIIHRFIIHHFHR